MPKHKLLQNRTFVFLLCLYVVGFIFGLFINTGSYIYDDSNKNFWTIFFANYWYIFLIWALGFSFIGFISTTIIVFFRAFVFGILTKLLIINDFRSFIIILILEIIIFFPALSIISLFSFKMSKEGFKIFYGDYNDSMFVKNYINLMLIITVVIAVYSLIIYYN